MLGALVILCGLSITTASTPSPNTQSLPDVLAAHPELSTLTSALETAGLLHDKDLLTKGPFTVFAPNNDAFAKLEKAELDRLLDTKNVKDLQDLLEVHVVAGAAIHSADLKLEQNVKSLEGQELSIVKDNYDGVRVGFPYQLYWPQLPAQVTSADNDASNGVVHIIDTVLVPPASPSPNSNSQSLPDLLSSHPELSTLTSALESAGLLHNKELLAKGPFTVFAPSNDAFAKLEKTEMNRLLDPKNVNDLQALLEVHVAAGVSLHSSDLKLEQNAKSLEGRELSIVKDNYDGVRVGFPYQLYWPQLPAQVTSADNEASNAVVHIIDTVLVPPASPSPNSNSQSLPDLLSSHPELSTLTTALEAAGLLHNKALLAKGPFTVFAPSNDAFAKLEKTEMDRLLDPKNVNELQNLLEVHVAAGATLRSADMKSEQNVKSLEGQELSIVKDSYDGVRVGFPYQLYWPQLPAQVTSADNEASNAVVHIIDSVLKPAASRSTDVLV